MRAIFKNAFQTGLRLWRMAAIVWFLQLCLAITLGMQVYNVLEASIGNSIEITKLMKHYDHTVLTDFLKVHGASITPLIGQLRWLLMVWMVFSVFLDGGLLACGANSQEASGRAFWQAGATYFFPFLKMAVFFLAAAAFWTGLIFVPLLGFFEPSLQVFPSEKYWVWLALSAVAVWLLGLTLLFIWSILSRLHKIRSDASIVACLKNGWLTFWKNKARYLGVLTGFAGLQAVLVLVYFLLEAFTGMKSPCLILFLFLVQQGFAFFRVMIRVMMYAGLAAG